MYEAYLSKIPFLRIFIAFAAGIQLRECTGPGGGPFLVAATASFIILVVVFRAGRNLISLVPGTLAGALTWTSLIALGAAARHDPEPVLLPPSVFTATVRSAPVRLKATWKVVLSDLRLTGEPGKGPVRSAPSGTGLRAEGTNNREYIPGKFLAYLGGPVTGQAPAPGQRLVLYAPLSPSGAPANPYQFDFGSYYARKGIFYRRYIPENHWAILGNAPRRGLGILAESWRFHFAGRLEALFPDEDVRGLLSALYLGMRDHLDPEEKTKFSRAGAMHFLAVSGLHAGIVFYLFYWLAGLIPGGSRTRQARHLVVIVSLWVYAALTGLSVPAVRATLMLSLWLAGTMVYRPLHPMNNLFFTAFVILAARPGMTGDLGFRLSFLAVAGILLFFRPLFSMASTGRRIPDALISLAVVSVCAQAATLPLALFYFHRLPHYFILTNLAVTPLVALLLYAAPLVVVAGILPAVQQPVTMAISGLVHLLLRVVGHINELPAAYSEGYYPRPVAAILLLVLSFSVLAAAAFRRGPWKMTFLCALLLLFLQHQVRSIVTVGRTCLYVYQVNRQTAVNIFGNGRNLLIAGEGLEETYDWSAMVDFWKQKHLPPPVRARVTPSDGLRLTRSVRARLTPSDGLRLTRSVRARLTPSGGGRPDSGGFYLHRPAPPLQHFLFIGTSGIRAAVLEGRSDLPTGAGKYLPPVDVLIVCRNALSDPAEIPALQHGTVLVLDGSNTRPYVRRILERGEELGIDCWSTREQGCFRMSRRIRLVHGKRP